MPLKRKLYLALLVILGLTGVYLIFTSGRVNIDFYSLVLFVIVGGFMLYLYLLYFRQKE